MFRVARPSGSIPPGHAMRAMPCVGDQGNMRRCLEAALALRPEDMGQGKRFDWVFVCLSLLGLVFRFVFLFFKEGPMFLELS